MHNLKKFKKAAAATMSSRDQTTRDDMITKRQVMNCFQLPALEYNLPNKALKCAL